MAADDQLKLRRVSLPAAAGVWLVRVYQVFIRPYVPSSCRFVPTCSEYAVQALREHGLLRGSWLACRRLLKCHPLCRGGLDPVPPSPPRSHE